MNGIDRRLDLIGARPVDAETLPNDRVTLGDEPSIPLAPVLIGEQHEIASWGSARGAARLGKEHEGEQAEHLRFVRYEGREQAPEPDRFTTEVVADEPIARRRRVSLVEDQI